MFCVAQISLILHPNAVAIPLQWHHSPLYGSHAWVGAPFITLLDRVESKAFRFINSPLHTDSIQPLSLFTTKVHYSLFYRLCDADWSSECMLLLKRGCNAHKDILFHPYSVQLSNAGVNWYSQPSRYSREHKFLYLLSESKVEVWVREGHTKNT